MRHRRIVGPTIISIVLCLLLADHLFFSANWWSITRFLGRLFGTFAAIVFPESPLLSSWVAASLVPVAVLAAALAILWLIFAGAKRAMNRATVNPSMSAGEILPAGIASAKRTDPDHTGAPVTPQRYNLFHRFVVLMCAAIIGFGLLTMAVVYSRFRPVVERHVQSRAALMVLGLTDFVSPALSGQRPAEVSLALDLYASKHDVVYAYLEDGDGRIIAHWPGDLLRYLRRDFPVSSERALQGIDVDYRGASVYEIAQRAGEGTSGFVHVAVDLRNADRESSQLITIIGAWTAVVLLGGALAMGWRARKIFAPWSQIVKDAGQISRGDFAIRLPLQRDDEIGQIARSLERMRSSLRAVTARLESGQMHRQSNE